MHLLQDVATSQQLPVNIQLRISRPVTILLHLLTNDLVVQHVDSLVLSQPYVPKDLPYFFSNSTTKLEYPHIGCRGVPFMKSTTLFFLTHFSITNLAFSFVISVWPLPLSSMSLQNLQIRGFPVLLRCVPTIVRLNIWDNMATKLYFIKGTKTQSLDKEKVILVFG